MLLLCVFRSPVLAVKAIVLNLLSIGAAFGLTVLVFQEGLGEEVLGFTSLGFVQGWMPLTLFMILFGISMDYEVFMVTRIREEHEKGAETTDAIARGLGRTGSVVTSAAAIMVAIFGVVHAQPHSGDEADGVRPRASPCSLDATIVRAALVPAFMKIAGQVELVDAGPARPPPAEARKLAGVVAAHDRPARSAAYRPFDSGAALLRRTPRALRRVLRFADNLDQRAWRRELRRRPVRRLVHDPLRGRDREPASGGDRRRDALGLLQRCARRREAADEAELVARARRPARP